MTWYRLSIVTPTVLGDAGWATWALDLSSLSKGSVWVNGFMLGAYWLLKDEHGEYSQQYYHLPRDYLKPEGESNNVVLPGGGGRRPGSGQAHTEEPEGQQTARAAQARARLCMSQLRRVAQAE